MKIKLNECNIYQNVKLKPGQFYELVINNDDDRSVLTWDYESNREILFTVYETTDADINDLSNGKQNLICVVKIFLTFFLSRWRLHVDYRCCGPKRKCQLQEEGTNSHKSSEGINSRIFWDGKGNFHTAMDESTDIWKFVSPNVLLWSPQFCQLSWLNDKFTITISHQFAFD